MPAPRKYPDELRERAVREVRSTGRPVAHVARDLGIHKEALRSWVRQAEAATHLRTDLPLDALEMALWRQKIKKDAGLIHHSDRGSQYVSIRYTERLAEVGASASVGSVSDGYDNAMAEALNGTFKAELIEHQGPWRDFDEAERAVFRWVTRYNGERLHSALGYAPPDEYEQAHWAQLDEVPQTA
ncbi:transposase [Streptomyces sp. HK10]|uniref:transposase n=1 Tax=Streptomyces sp. HK10 TaxID=3373255 RepID=UPI0037489517